VEIQKMKVVEVEVVTTVVAVEAITPAAVVALAM
jgi:hypothetical protein